jgi:predicted DNA-binding transcriptional regulator AlpA
MILGEEWASVGDADDDGADGREEAGERARWLGPGRYPSPSTQAPEPPDGPRAGEDFPPVVVPSGYLRDRRGTWRYRATGEAVPGARDLTLKALYRFAADEHSVLVPLSVARTDPALDWCLFWVRSAGHLVDAERSRGGRRGTRLAVAVPREAWERRAGRVLGLVAPELMPERLLDTDAVARLCCVRPQTIATYLARGQMPEPVARLGNSPLWSRAIVEYWLESRPGQGVNGGRRRRRGRSQRLRGRVSAASKRGH